MWLTLHIEHIYFFVKWINITTFFSFSPSGLLCSYLERSCCFKSWKAKVETNSPSLVSEDTLFVCSQVVSLLSKSLAVLIFLFALMCQVHYFVIFINQKSPGSCALSPAGVWKLNISVKSQFPQWHYANQPLPVLPFLLPFIYQSASSIWTRLFICCGLLYSFTDVFCHAQHCSSCFYFYYFIFFHFALLRCPRPTWAFICFSVCVCVRMCVHKYLVHVFLTWGGKKDKRNP